MCAAQLVFTVSHGLFHHLLTTESAYVVFAATGLEDVVKVSETDGTTVSESHLLIQLIRVISDKSDGLLIIHGVHADRTALSDFDQGLVVLLTVVIREHLGGFHG